MGKSRIEEILENMLGETDELEEPKSRNEALLQQILNNTELIRVVVEDVSDDGNGTVTINVR